MTIDLWMLVASAGLQWALIMTAATPRLLLNGIPWAVSNRETKSVEVPKWAERAQRTSDNMQENLVLLAILVLVVHVADLANDTTALGTQVFLGARIVHTLVFFAGVPWVRTVAWAVSVVGMGMVASVLF